ncbi:TNR25 factor, partial [Eudromia elegans]|nr:TNR25 factor [Eudromia elegans]
PTLSAQVLLATLWLAAGGSSLGGLGQPSGTLPRPPLLPSRLWRFSTRAPCPVGTRWSERGRRCCTPCPAGESCSWGHPQGCCTDLRRPHRPVCIGTFLRSPCTSHGNDSVCEPCPAGTFHSLSNTALSCRACYECDRQGEPRHHAPRRAALRPCSPPASTALQSVLSNCSATSNVVCSCEAGYYKECVDSHCSSFHCRECRTCAGSLVERPCSLAQDTQCGSCKPDFYAEGGKCHPCPPRDADTCSEECQRACNRYRGAWGAALGAAAAPHPPRTLGSSLAGAGLEYLLLGLAGPLFLGALAIYHKRRRQDASGCSPLPTSPRCNSHDPVLEPKPHPAAKPGSSPDPVPGCSMRSCCGELGLAPTVPTAPKEAAALPSPLSKGASGCQGSWYHCSGLAAAIVPEATALLQWCHPNLGAQPEHMLQGGQLYAIIDTVPLRRWKEFMRMLGLRDTDIEVVELEFAHVRDQQYEMLKRWGQQSSASLSHVFAALERMELEGCAQALRLRL